MTGTALRILVVDDSNTIRRSAEIFLKQGGHEVMLAEDGFDALAKINDYQPNLVFCDILMPRLDGYQTCAIIKRNTRFDANSIDGNPSVKIEIHLSPDGTILGKPRILRTSGNPEWDDAALEGIERAEILPRDPTLGTAPPIMVIDRRPKD